MPLPRVLPGAIALALLAHAAPSQAQFVDSLKRTARAAAEHEARRKVAELVRDGVRCVFDDFDCIRRAEASGKTAVMTDDGGTLLVDKDGVPITDPDEARGSAAAPGTGLWTAYDFVPGERVLFSEDLTAERVGRFPKRLVLVRRNWAILEQQGRPVLRSRGPAGAALAITLPEVLPERYTIEMDVHLSHASALLGVASTQPAGRISRLDANWWQIGERGTGVAKGRTGVEALTRVPKAFSQGMAPVRIMVDGGLATVFVRDRRVATVPNGRFPRTAMLYIEDIKGADDRRPVSISRIQVAASGGDIYEALETDGRAVTRGILFAAGTDRIRPESTPTLSEIGRMLQQHPDLRLALESHTDRDGEEALTLSQRRADAVRRYLVSTFRVDGSRIQARGMGASKPARDNATAEGRAQNRRVEIVRQER